MSDPARTPERMDNTTNNRTAGRSAGFCSMQWLGDWSNENRRLTNPTVGFNLRHDNERKNESGLPVLRTNSREAHGRRRLQACALLAQMPARKRVLRRSAQRQGAELVGADARRQGCGRMPRVLQLAANLNQNQAMNCPHCGKRINVGKLLRSKRPTAAQKEAARLNGAKGGRPKAPNAKPLNR